MCSCILLQHVWQQRWRHCSKSVQSEMKTSAEQKWMNTKPGGKPGQINLYLILLCMKMLSPSLPLPNLNLEQLVRTLPLQRGAKLSLLALTVMHTGKHRKSHDVTHLGFQTRGKKSSSHRADMGKVIKTYALKQLDLNSNPNCYHIGSVWKWIKSNWIANPRNQN